MKLAVDIGNTSISIGLFNKFDLVVKTNLSNINNFEEFINSIKEYDIKCVIISSVVPKLTIKYKKLFEQTYNYPVVVIDYKFSNLSLSVEKPESVGSDRLCNLCAVIKDYSLPAIIIDFGTATTYDVVNISEEFIGGAISSGIETSAKYLIEKAALLSKTNLIFPQLVIGKNTTTNIQSGIMFGAVDQVEGMIKRIEKETNIRYSIILTGGFSNLISQKLIYKHIVDSNLTLKGIIYMYESNS
jgi:type III pantothenate kinase